MGRSSGQRVSVHNCTPFMLRRDEKEGIKDVCGESWHHPTEIPPKLNQDNPNIEGLSYLQNNGNSDYYGSEIIYTYRIMETPDTTDHSTRWLLRIYSIGAYKMQNACFAAQVIKCDTSGPGTSGVTESLCAQVSWRDTRKHHESNPNPDKDGNTPGCPFTIEILSEPEKFPEGGEAFYKIELKIGMKPIKVDHIEECEEEMVGEEISSVVIQQNLLPGGRNEIIYEHTQEKYKGMKRKVDDKWGRALKYEQHFEWGINLAAEQKVKAGNDKVGAEATRKVGVSFGGKHGWETNTTREHLVSTEDTDTYTVKRAHKWTYTEDVKEEKSVLITVKKITYRKNFKWEGGIIAYKERYVYIYEPTFVYFNSNDAKDF